MWLTDPSRSPIWVVSDVVPGVDASGGEQWLGSINSRFRQNYPTTTGNLPVEPLLLEGLGAPPLSQMTHVMVQIGRVGGSGTWRAGAVFQRFNTSDEWPDSVSGGADPEIPLTDINIPTVTSSQPSITFYTNPFPNNFMRANPGDAALADEFVGRFWLRPGSGTADVYWTIILFTGTQVATRPSYGNHFSGVGR